MLSVLIDVLVVIHLLFSVLCNFVLEVGNAWLVFYSFYEWLCAMCCQLGYIDYLLNNFCYSQVWFGGGHTCILERDG